MLNQNKIFSFKIKRQTKNVFPRDVERIVNQNQNAEYNIWSGAATLFAIHPVPFRNIKR